MDIEAFLEDYGEKPSTYINLKKATRQEKVEYCERNLMIWCVSGNGTHYERKAFWCRYGTEGQNGERACKICGPYREWKREKEVRDKLGAAFASSSTLYMTRVPDEDDVKKLLFRIKKRGGRYLSIPLNDEGGKLFLLDIYDKISNPVAVGLQDAADSFMPLRHNTEWGYFSGGLGKTDQEDEDDTISYVIPARLNVAVPKELMAGVETEAVLTVGIDTITRENAVEAVFAKLALMERILVECGFPDAKHVGEVEITMSLRKLQQTWFSAKIVPASVTDMKMYPIATSLEIGKTIESGLETLKEKNRSYVEQNPDWDIDRR
jgi:hypothetical protein